MFMCLFVRTVMYSAVSCYWNCDNDALIGGVAITSEVIVYQV